MTDKNITEALQQLKHQRQWDRANPVNPVCVGCDRRDIPEYIDRGFCAECRDTLLFLKTGCRFGLSPCCGSEDCHMPLDLYEADMAELYAADPSQFSWVDPPKVRVFVRPARRRAWEAMDSDD